MIFVLVLVSLLRMFGGEAFVIPTGSMATTLLGAHKQQYCPECGQSNVFNGHSEVENNDRVRSGYCQNCREPMDLQGTGVTGGDRVLVAKFLYEGFVDPARWQVIVFKCPDIGKANINFIKRLVGLPDETVRIYYGDIYVQPKGGEFQIARKPPEVMMSIRRLVNNNDLPAKDLLEIGAPPRWSSESPSAAWTSASEGRVLSAPAQGDNWLRYRNLLGGGNRTGGDEPRVTTDFEAYNDVNDREPDIGNFVGDLMVECTATLPELKGTLTLELVESARVYQCQFDLAGRKVNLLQNGKVIASGDSPITGSGSYALRFADFDDRLTVWVDDKLLFGDGVDVAPMTPDEFGPVAADLVPVRIGAKDIAVTLSNLQVYRDLYYTQHASPSDVLGYGFIPSNINSESSLPDWRQRLARVMAEPREFVMQEDEFFMLGDNSPASSDAREWSTTHVVKRHMLLGRALILYWPVWRWRFVE